MERLVRVALLFIVRPHANDFYGLLSLNDLIDKSMLNVDSPGIS